MLYTQTDLPMIAAKVLECVTALPAVVTFTGELGAGKTTLAQEVARQLGVVDTVTSPTFTIAQIYKTTDSHIQTLIHIDAYRLSGEEDARRARIDSLLATPASLTVIEWAGNIQALIPVTALDVILHHTTDEDKRIIHIKSGSHTIL